MNGNYRTCLLINAVSVTLLCAGCATEGTDEGPSEMSQMAAGLKQQQMAVPPRVDAKPAPPQPKLDGKPEVVTRYTPKAGKSLRGSGGYLSAVLSTRFLAEHATVFEMQIPKALSLYQATHGNYPKSHDEFMEKIINENLIQLPELEDGYEYWYDSSDHRLKLRPIKPVANPKNPSLIPPQ